MKSADRHRPVFHLLTILLHSTQRQRGLLKDGKLFLWGSDCYTGQKTQTVADYVIDSSVLLTPELTAHCLEWVFVKWMKWTDMWQQSEVNIKKNEWRASWDLNRPKDKSRHINLTHHSTSLKVKLLKSNFMCNLSMICWESTESQNICFLHDELLNN